MTDEDLTAADLDAMSAALAHELRSPLVRISAALDLVRSADAGDPDVDLGIEIMERALRDGLAIVDRLRLLHRPEAELVIGLEPTDVADVVRRTVDELRDSVLSSHPVTVETRDRMELHVDPVGVRQILTNLLTNAASYSPDGSDVVVRATDERDHIRIEVHNQGHGVAPEDAERIFARWQRGSDGTGLGLGLYLSRRIARAHGGDLRFEPAEIEGSIFVLELPRRPDYA